jgi:transcriptional regulator with XRE-family HTH domain
MVESPKTGSERLGEAVRRAREQRGMSRRELAETTGLSYPYISQIETGYRMPSTPALRSLADALGLRPDTLFAAIPPGAGRDAELAGPTVPVRPTAFAAPRAAAPAPPAAAFRPLTPGHTSAPVAAGGASRPAMAGRAPGPATAEPAADSAGAGGPRAAPAVAPEPTGADTAIDPAVPDTSEGARTASGPTGSAAGAAAELTAGAAAELTAGAADGWVVNRAFRPTTARPAATSTPTGTRDRTIDRAAALLTSLPPEDRLPALSAVQARVVRSVIDDEVRRNGSRDGAG